MAKQYEVIANHKVFGFAKGERFHADLSPEQEERKLGVSLAIVREPVPEFRRRVALTSPAVAPGDAPPEPSPASPSAMATTEEQQEKQVDG